MVKSIVIPFLLICGGAFSLAAQTSIAEENKYAVGATYLIRNSPTGPVVYWDGELAAEELFTWETERMVTVNPPTSIKPRLVLYLFEDGRVDYVVDLKFQRHPLLPLPTVREDGTDKKMDAVAYTFENGVTFSYEAGIPRFVLNNEELAYTGENGYYRVHSADFDAGISFGPDYGSRIFHYFTRK